VKIYDNIVQGTPEWDDIRCGKITGSKMNTLMQKGGVGDDWGAGAVTYAYELAAERMLLRNEEPKFNLPQFQRGHEEEVLVKKKLLEEYWEPIQEVGFIQLNDYFGVSPDGIVGGEILLECKSIESPSKFLRFVDEEKIPNDHYAQMQAGMYAGNFQSAWYVQYNGAMRSFHRVIVARDETFVQDMAVRIANFNQYVDKLKMELHEKVRQGNF